MIVLMSISCSKDETIQDDSFTETIKTRAFDYVEHVRENLSVYTNLIRKDDMGEIISIESLTSSSNPYLDDRAKEHIVKNAHVSINDCTGQIVLVIVTELPSGGTEHWGVDMNIETQMNPCIKYHSNGNPND